MFPLPWSCVGCLPRGTLQPWQRKRKERAMIGILSATGQLGQKILDDVLAGGAPPKDLVAICRDPARLEGYARRGVQVRRGDYDDAPSLEAAFEGVERL